MHTNTSPAQNTNTSFETGAATHQANNLVLSVINDGQVYQDRLHAGFAMLQGTNHSMSFGDIIKGEAQKQRMLGSKFTASHIKEATGIVQALTLEQCQESFLQEWDGQYITTVTRKWWDKVNGCSYFSCHVMIPTKKGFKSFNIPMQYGYGDQCKFEAVKVLKSLGFFEGNDKPRWELPIVFSDQGFKLKRDMFEGVYIK